MPIALLVTGVYAYGSRREVSRFDLFLRTGILIGYLFIIGHIFFKLSKLTKNGTLSISRKKQLANLIVAIFLLIVLFFICFAVAQFHLYENATPYTLNYKTRLRKSLNIWCLYCRMH